jgi:hypothetical protein
MRYQPVFSFLLALIASSDAIGFEYNIKYALSSEYHDVNRKSPYFLAGSLNKDRFFSLRNDFELRFQWNKVTAQAGLRLKSRHEDSSVSSDLNQLYYDDKNDQFSWTVGKKVISWGVGHAFRPLDVIQHEDRRAINSASLVGVPLILVEKFSNTDALSWVWTNPLNGRDTGRDDESFAFRYFQFSDEFDFHVVGRFSRSKRVEIGLGGAYIINGNMSLFGSVIYAERYFKDINTLSDGRGIYSYTDPLEKQFYSDGFRADIGFQWTGNSGIGLLLEAWYDGEAYSQSDWKRLTALTKRQIALSDSVPGYVLQSNIAWSAKAFANDNLVRENFLVRLSYDDSDGFKPYIDLLFAPSDGGLMTTAALAYEKNYQRYSLGFRHYGGKKGSVFHDAPEREVTWARLDLSF